MHQLSKYSFMASGLIVDAGACPFRYIYLGYASCHKFLIISKVCRFKLPRKDVIGLDTFDLTGKIGHTKLLQMLLAIKRLAACGRV